MHPVTGRTNYPADIAGNFVTCTKVSAYKCGQRISEIYREIQVVLVPPICNLGDTTNGIAYDILVHYNNTHIY